MDTILRSHPSLDVIEEKPIVNDFIEALNDKNLLNFPNENGYLNKRKFLNLIYELIKHVENLNTVKEYYDFQIESGPILKEGQVKDVVGLDKRRRWTKEGETWNPAEQVTENQTLKCVF